MNILATDGSTVRIQGYAAVLGAQAGNLRISPKCRFVVAGDDCKLTVHHVTGVSLASARAGTLRLWTDKIGLAFEADAIADDRGIAWALQYLAAGKRGCSYLGHETTRIAADGMTEITLIDLVDVCLSDVPTFIATAAWRSDADRDDVRGRAGAMRAAFGSARDRELVPLSWKMASPAARSLTPRARARWPVVSMTPATAAFDRELAEMRRLRRPPLAQTK